MMGVKWGAMGSGWARYFYEVAIDLSRLPSVLDVKLTGVLSGFPVTRSGPNCFDGNGPPLGDRRQPGGLVALRRAMMTATVNSHLRQRVPSCARRAVVGRLGSGTGGCPAARMGHHIERAPHSMMSMPLCLGLHREAPVIGNIARQGVGLPLLAA